MEQIPGMPKGLAGVAVIECGTCGGKAFYSVALVKWLHMQMCEPHKVTTPKHTSAADRHSDQQAGKEYGS